MTGAPDDSRPTPAGEAPAAPAGEGPAGAGTAEDAPAASAGKAPAGPGTAEDAPAASAGKAPAGPGPAGEASARSHRPRVKDDPGVVTGRGTPTEIDAAGAEAEAAGKAEAAAEAEAGEAADEGEATGATDDDLFRLDMSKDLSGLEALLSDDFARISAERDEYLDALQRRQADFDNFRKRAERQLAESRERANEALLLRLLPVLDALDLAMTHLRAEDSPGEAASSLVQIHTLLRDTLAREGLERIDSVGVPFDPTIHEATAMDDSESSEPDDGELAGPAVTEVWRPGYRIRDRVIRPAMVRVRG